MVKRRLSSAQGLAGHWKPEFQTSFATLEPANAAAQKAFHEAVGAIPENEKFSYHRRYIEIDGDTPVMAKYREVDLKELTGSDTEISTEPDDNTREHLEKDKPLRWTGRYIFSFTSTPDNYEWVLGTGRWTTSVAESKPGLVDFLLSPKSSRDVRSIHALFAFHKETGHLCLRNLRQQPNVISLDGEAFSSLTSYRLLNKGSARLSIGALEYVFAYATFTQEEEHAFQRTK